MSLDIRTLKSLSSSVADVLKDALKSRDERIAQLEARLSALETAPKSLDYTGTWQRATEYRRNQGVTHKGQLWLCLTDNRAVEPGTSAGCWQLADKREHR